ncbi:hypothetical protein CXF81_18975 [Glaciecola sp. 33A]|nr:hypothetical protein CXF81_18975 [Glaciecola sp. 33A]
MQVTEEGYEKILSQIEAMTAELLLNALLKPKYWVKKVFNFTKKHVQFVLSIDSDHHTQILRFWVLCIQLQAPQQTS